MDLSELLRARRKQLQLTQQQLAEAVKVSKQAVSKWENGTALPDILAIPKLAAVLDLSPVTLIETIWGAELEMMRFDFSCTGYPSFLEEGLVAVRSTRGRYRVRCTEADYDRLLQKYGESRGIKTQFPEKKVLQILRHQLPSHENYSPEEKYTRLLSDCCNRFCGTSYTCAASNGTDADFKRTSILRKLMADAYREVLTYDYFRYLCNNDGDQVRFDLCYQRSCDMLLAEEMKILQMPAFSDSVSFRREWQYLSPHYVLQAIFADMVTSGVIGQNHPVRQLLHATVPEDREAQKPEDFDAYLHYQASWKQYADREGTTRIDLSIAGRRQLTQRAGKRRTRT